MDRYRLPKPELLNLPLEGQRRPSLREFVDSDEWHKTIAQLPFAMGRDTSGNLIITDLSQMPHLLIGSVSSPDKYDCLNSILASLLCSLTADELQLILIDSTMRRMLVFNQLPHLAVPVVTDDYTTRLTFKWIISEMERRFKLFVKVRVRNISEFNSRSKPWLPSPTTKPALPATLTDREVEITRAIGLFPEKLTYIVVMVSELAGLIAHLGKEVEMAIARLTALGRATGIHLIVATQQPSNSFVTGIIKANIPSRVAFRMTAPQSSHIILDAAGAELLSENDFLYSSHAGKAIRVRSTFVEDEEIQRLIDYVQL